VQVPSLYISSACDVVNIELLIKRLKKEGLSNGVLGVIRVWLENRSNCVGLDGINSVLFDVLLGTLQGCVLGPVLYSIFVSPLFDIVSALSFANDSYAVKSNKNKEESIKDM
jgi:hypothetical protein